MSKIITSHPLPFTAFFYQQRISWLRGWAWESHCRIPNPAPLLAGCVTRVKFISLFSHLQKEVDDHTPDLCGSLGVT